MLDYKKQTDDTRYVSEPYKDDEGVVVKMRAAAVKAVPAVMMRAVRKIMSSLAGFNRDK